MQIVQTCSGVCSAHLWSWEALLPLTSIHPWAAWTAIHSILSRWSLWAGVTLGSRGTYWLPRAEHLCIYSNKRNTVARLNTVVQLFYIQHTKCSEPNQTVTFGSSLLAKSGYQWGQPAHIWPAIETEQTTQSSVRMYVRIYKCPPALCSLEAAPQW